MKRSIKKHFVIKVAGMLALGALNGCDVHHEKTWTVISAPIGSNRFKIAQGVVKEESEKAGLERNSREGEGVDEVKFGYLINENPKSRVSIISCRSYNNDLIINLNSGFLNKIGSGVSFLEFRKNIDTALKRKIGNSYIVE